jgi:FAD binding domain-containing protein
VLQTEAPGRPLDGRDVRALRERLTGQVLAPGDDGYEQARVLWNGAIDRRPGAIARCEGTDDVLAAVRWARAADALVAVRGGGHNVAGTASCDGGLVLDLSAMKGIQVDPGGRSVWAQPGLLWASWTRPPRRTAWPRPAGSSPTPASPGSRSAAGSAGSCASPA